MAEALTGRAVAARLPGRYERRETSVLLEDGTAVPAEADRHPDAVAEAIRWQICEGEIVQIVGRGRGVNRTAADPLEVLVLTDRPLPLPVADTVAWEELEPVPADLMLAEGGVALLDAADAAQAYPALWPNRAGTAGSPEAARKAFQRARCGTSPNRELPHGGCPAPLARVAYQRTGSGRRPAAAVFDPRVVPNIRAWLQERRIWLLARCDVVTAEPAASPPGPPLAEEQPARSRAPAIPFDAPPSAPRTMEEPPDGVRAAFEVASPPPVSPPIPGLGLSREQLARLRGMSEHLVAARPPRLWGDFTDPLRVEAWRTRCAKARADHADRAAAAEAQARVDSLVRFAAEAEEALAEPELDPEEEREARQAEAPSVVAMVRWADADSPELTAWFGGAALALAA
jgi:hypothetical protein